MGKANEWILPSGGVSTWRVCYQRGYLVWLLYFSVVVSHESKFLFEWAKSSEFASAHKIAILSLMTSKKHKWTLFYCILDQKATAKIVLPLRHLSDQLKMLPRFYSKYI